MHDIVFTKEFKEGYEKVPSNIYPKIERFLKLVKENPVVKNNNITVLKNQSRGFRVRFGDYNTSDSFTKSLPRSYKARHKRMRI